MNSLKRTFKVLRPWTKTNIIATTLLAVYTLVAASLTNSGWTAPPPLTHNVWVLVIQFAAFLVFAFCYIIGTQIKEDFKLHRITVMEEMEKLTIAVDDCLNALFRHELQGTGAHSHVLRGATDALDRLMDVRYDPAMDYALSRRLTGCLYHVQCRVDLTIDTLVGPEEFTVTLCEYSVKIKVAFRFEKARQAIEYRERTL